MRGSALVVVSAQFDFAFFLLKYSHVLGIQAFLFFDREVKMSYLFQAILFVCVFSCALIADAFWSWSSLADEKGLANLCYKSIAVGGGLVLYAGIDYLMLDYLMLAPGEVYVMA
jgi:hypothetical protein